MNTSASELALSNAVYFRKQTLLVVAMRDFDAQLQDAVDRLLKPSTDCHSDAKQKTL